MKEEEILDVAEKPAGKGLSKWKAGIIAMFIASLQSILIIPIVDLFDGELRDFLLGPTFSYISSQIVYLIALAFFIKKVKPDNLDQQELFLWSMFIMLVSFFIPFIYDYLIPGYGYNISDTFLRELSFCLVLGYIPAIGLYHFIKSNNWAMLVLMIALSWMALESIKGILF